MPCKQQSHIPTKAIDKLAGTLESLQKPTGPKGASSNEDQKSREVEIVHTQEILDESWKAHDKAVANTYELLRNLLSSDLQSQWDQVCCKMQESDLWAGVNGQMTTGRRPSLWIAFQDCLKINKLTVFTADGKGNRLLFNLIPLLVSTPACQKLLYQP
jgi:hypothetical protein